MLLRLTNSLTIFHRLMFDSLNRLYCMRVLTLIISPPDNIHILPNNLRVHNYLFPSEVGNSRTTFESILDNRLRVNLQRRRFLNSHLRYKLRSIYLLPRINILPRIRPAIDLLVHKGIPIDYDPDSSNLFDTF